MSRLSQIVIAAAIAASLSAGCAGCQSAESSAEPRPGRAPAQASAGGDPSEGLTIAVGEVRAEPGIDPAAMRAALSDAETALLWCVDPDGSTGVLSLRLSIERDGAVGDLRLGETTTYGSQEARECVQRIVSAMRFAPPLAARAGVDVLLEVRSRARAVSQP